MNRIVLHADMDAFFAAVEQLDNPDLRGRPVIIGHPHPRSVVSTASYEARVFGVHSAMPMVEALSRCPHAVVVPPRMSRYQELSAIIMAVFDEFSPLVEPLSVDEGFLEMTGAEGLFGSPKEMGRKLKARVAEATGGLTVSVGVAENKFVAKVASDIRKPDGLTVVPFGEAAAFLAPLPVSRIFGVGKVVEQKLLAAGIRTIGQLAQVSRTSLVAQFGQLGERMADFSRGLDDRPVAPRGTAASVGREYTLERDVRGVDLIWPHLERSADRVARDMRKKGVLAGGVRVKLKTNDFKLLTRQCHLDDPTSNSQIMLEAARSLLEKFDLSLSYRLVGLAAFALQKEPRQMDLFGRLRQQDRRKLDEAMDKVADRFGDGVLTRANLLKRGC